MLGGQRAGSGAEGREHPPKSAGRISDGSPDVAVVPPTSSRSRPGRDWLSAGLLLAVALALWLPRLGGPLDMRYDAGAYYVLGTSLAEGKGYRLLNEPGEIEAIQYTPLLPLLAAAAQRVAGSSAVAEGGHVLRLAFFACFLFFVAAVYVLARRFVEPGFATLVALLVMLHVQTTFLSDLFFAELPFSLVSVAFVLVLPAARRSRGWSAVAGTLAIAGYLLRAAGISLLAAWVGEASLRRRWASAARRAAVTLLAILAWQGYIAHVESGAEYAHPAYAYQRAGYQFHNVGYLENIAYVDPFAPELGKASASDWARRLLGNVALIPKAWGETISAPAPWWQDLKVELEMRGRRSGGPHGAFLTAFASILGAAGPALLGLGCLVIAGLILLASRGELLIPLYVVTSALLASLTPWPQQFSRYFQPLAPFLALGALVLLAELWRSARAGRARGHRGTAIAAGVGALAAGCLVLLGLVTETYSQLRMWKKFHEPATFVDAAGRPQSQRLFAYEEGWRSYEGALRWLAANAPQDAVVATQAPQWTYLWTGRKSVFPPAEPPERAQRLLDELPATYLVLDKLGFSRLSAKQAEDVIRSHPERWRLDYESEDRKTLVYRRLEGPGAAR
jgi:hypothetical protein